MMIKTFAIALRLTFATLLITGVAYPLAMTGLSRALFGYRSGGSLLKGEDGKTIGSELLGQPFARAAYFQPRPSAAGAGYDAGASSGSNLGPTSAKLRDRAEADLKRLRAENPDAPAVVPADLVTASGSGLDPHISPEAAYWQAPRVARARSVEVGRVEALVVGAVQPRQFGVLGEPRVNVLLLNLALDREFGVIPSGNAVAAEPAAGAGATIEQGARPTM